VVYIDWLLWNKAAIMRLETLRRRYKDEILRIADECKADNIRVFGSVARGEAKRGSDIDFLVHFQPGVGLFTIGGFQYRVAELLKRKVDVIPDCSRMHPVVRESIARDVVPL
jgi:predicted nucleotidyltransferase